MAVVRSDLQSIGKQDKGGDLPPLYVDYLPAIERLMLPGKYIP